MRTHTGTRQDAHACSQKGSDYCRLHACMYTGMGVGVNMCVYMLHISQHMILCRTVNKQYPYIDLLSAWLRHTCLVYSFVYAQNTTHMIHVIVLCLNCILSC